MTPQFINISNHPSSKWSSEQLDAARKLAAGQFNCKPEDVSIIDIPFPNIDPRSSIVTVSSAALGQAQEIEKISLVRPVIVHIMGEMTYVHNFVSYAINAGIRCCASTTEHIVMENPDGTKTSSFEFVQFRPY